MAIMFLHQYKYKNETKVAVILRWLESTRLFANYRPLVTVDKKPRDNLAMKEWWEEHMAYPFEVASFTTRNSHLIDHILSKETGTSVPYETNPWTMYGIRFNSEEDALLFMMKWQ